MSFLEWTFLLGAVAVIGPVAAHLLSKPRFRRVPFTMLRFLRSGQRESYTRRRLRDLLILLLRCAIIAVIAMLFAQPLLHVASKPQPHKSIHYLAVDDSMSMAYRDNDATLFTKAIEAAVEYVTSLSDESICNIHALASRRTFQNLGKGQAIVTLRQLTAAPKNADVEEFLSALRQARRAISPGDSIRAAIFSDFAPDVLAQLDRVGEPAVVDAIRYEATLASNPIDNVAIAGARLANGNPPALDVTIANCDATLQTRTLTAQGPDIDSSSLKVDLAPQERQVCHVQLSLRSATGHRPCVPVELSLSSHDGLAEDDSYRLAVYLPPSTATHILLVGRGDETFLFETAVQALAKQGHQLRKATEDRLAPSDFEWADAAVFASPPASPICQPAYIESLLKKGGRLICFATRAGISDTSRSLFERGLLPALPDKWVQSVSYPEPAPFTPESFGLETVAARSLINYRLDKTAMKGYWACRTAPQSQCVWRLANGTGFVYGKAVGPGLSIFVNTSIDTSLGLLAKSQAWVAFCQYLVGRTDQVRGYCFSTMEAPTLYLPQVRPAAQVWVENCDGSKVLAKPQGVTLKLPAPTGLGWIKTLDQPPLYAGINLPDGETEIVVPSAQTVANAVKRAFLIEDHRKRDTALAEAQISQKPIWKAFAWAAIAMVLLESAVANRLKR